MKNRLLLTTLLVLFSLVYLRINTAVGGEQKKGGISWLKYDKAMDLAKKQNKHIIIDFATTWCGWCKKMHASTYQDAKIVETISKDFVAAVVDGDSYDILKLKDGDITEKGLTRQFGVTGYPTTWFLESDGKKIAPAPGYIDTKTMQYVLDYVRTNTNDKMTFQEFVTQQTLKTGSK